jgi:hypothetical protein
MANQAFEEGRRQGEAYAVENIAIVAANASPALSARSRQADPDFLLGFYEGITTMLKKLSEPHQRAQTDEDEAEDAE